MTCKDQPEAQDVKRSTITYLTYPCRRQCSCRLWWYCWNLGPAPTSYARKALKSSWGETVVLPTPRCCGLPSSPPSSFRTIPAKTWQELISNFQRLSVDLVLFKAKMYRVQLNMIDKVNLITFNSFDDINNFGRNRNHNNHYYLPI